MRALAGWAVVLVLAGLARAAGVFDVGGKPPERVTVTVGEDIPEGFAPRSVMLDQLAGVLATLRADEIRALRGCAAGPGVKAVDVPADARRIGVVHAGGGSETRRVEILRNTAGEFIARELGAEGRKGTRLDGDKFESLAAGWPAYRGDFTRPEAIRAGEATDMPRPPVHGWRLVDASFLGQRFNGGRASQVTGATRELAKEEYRVRLPRPYDATKAAGVVIWVDARSQADVPAPLGEACDHLGLIVACPREAPNSRAVADRYQVTLDALASAEANFLVDRRRVYVSGLSGGGQIATHLWACMPDTFTGAVPTVALASYRNVVVGTGKMWQGTIGKPTPALMKQLTGHRCAAVTGSNDFNRMVVHEVSKLWIGDGQELRVFDFEGLGHEVATMPQFLETLRWVDEPYRTQRDGEIARAEAVLSKALTPAGEPAPGSTQALVEVTAAAPWSDPAWKAARALGARPRGGAK